jgi:uncharacterized protein YkwD
MRLINAKRKEKGLREFDTPAALTTAARSYATDWASGKSPKDDQITSLGYANWDMISGAESDTDQAAEVVSALLKDTQEELAARILSSNWTAIGVGYAQKSGTNEYSWVIIYACTAINKPEVETEVMRLINVKRAERGLPAFNTPEALTTVARSYANDLACGKSPGSSIGEQLKAWGYSLGKETWGGASTTDQAAGRVAGLLNDDEATLADGVFSTKWTAIGAGYAQKTGTNENRWVMIYAVPS